MTGLNRRLSLWPGARRGAPGGASAPTLPETARARILYVSHVGLLGGAERSLLDLITALDRQRYDLRVVLPNAGEFSEHLKRLDVPFDICPLLARLRQAASLPEKAAQTLRLIAGGAALRSLVRAHSPALVHANSAAAALYAQCLPWTMATPTVWHFRDLALPKGAGRLLARRCARIVVPSVSCRNAVANVADDKNIVVIPNGIELPTQADAAEIDTDESQADCVTISMIGQLAAWKGHMLAIEVARLVVERCPHVRFFIVGDDRLKPLPLSVGQLRRTVETLGLAGRITVSGYVDNVPEVLQNTDILLHPAFPEPAGRVVIEAMAAGRPVIAFDGQHGPAEIIRDGVDGLLVGPRSVSALADAVVLLAENAALRNSLGKAARNRALAEFGRSLMAERIETLYRGLAPAAVQA